MQRVPILIATLVAYNGLLLAIGWWARSRTRDAEEFFLGGRRLGPVVAAISYSASASSAWTLLGLSGAAYIMGVSAVWIAAGSLLGMLVAWIWVAPRMLSFTRARGHLTFTDFLADGSSGSIRTAIVCCASLIIIVSFVFYVAAQFQGAGNTFSDSFDIPMGWSIVLGALVIMLYTFMGGFWAVSVTDVVQGTLMAAVALILPIAAVSAVGGPAGLLAGLAAVSTPAQLSWSAGNSGLLALGVILGGLAISLGTFGQPHLLVRFMALRDVAALRQARWITMAWYGLVFCGMLLVGLAGHVLHAGLDNPEKIFFVLADSLFGAFVASIIIAAVLSAIMSTADSQLLVAASAIAHDLGLGKGDARRSLLVSRLTIVALVVLAVTVAIVLPERIFSRVLFAWAALGAAFGPTLFLRLAGFTLKPVGVLLSISSGFGFALLFYLLPNGPGDLPERAGAFVLALAVLLPFSRRALRAANHSAQG